MNTKRMCQTLIIFWPRGGGWTRSGRVSMSSAPYTSCWHAPAKAGAMLLYLVSMNLADLEKNTSSPGFPPANARS